QPVAAGFLMSGMVTNPPAVLEVYVDGEVERRADAPGADPYEAFSIETSEFLESGVHQFDLVARWADTAAMETVMIEVVPPGGNQIITIPNCGVGGGGGAG